MQQPKPEDIKQHYADVFLVTKSGKVVGQKRDDKTTIDNPGKVAAFGGSVEAGETPLQAAVRELQEETNLRIPAPAMISLTNYVSWRTLTNEWQVGHFYFTCINDELVATLEVYEGQGWAYITGPDDPNLIDGWQPLVKQLFDKIQEDNPAGN